MVKITLKLHQKSTQNDNSQYHEQERLTTIQNSSNNYISGSQNNYKKSGTNTGVQKTITTQSI